MHRRFQHAIVHALSATSCLEGSATGLIPSSGSLLRAGSSLCSYQANCIFPSPHYRGVPHREGFAGNKHAWRLCAPTLPQSFTPAPLWDFGAFVKGGRVDDGKARNWGPHRTLAACPPWINPVVGPNIVGDKEIWSPSNQLSADRRHQRATAALAVEFCSDSLITMKFAATMTHWVYTTLRTVPAVTIQHHVVLQLPRTDIAGIHPDGLADRRVCTHDWKVSQK